jgi:MarR family transcriptional regulator, transcriptional regulator for hemolysin
MELREHARGLPLPTRVLAIVHTRTICMAADFTITPQDHFGYRISLIARRWRQRVDDELESYGLSEASWRPLLYLATCKGVPRQRDLAEALQIGCPALVRLLDTLEAKRLVERIDVDDDRRAKQVQLTAEGRRLARRVHDIIQEIDRRLLEEVSAADLAHCNRIFSSIEHRLDGDPTEPTREP